MTEAPECRIVCKPTVEGSFARFAAALRARSALRGSHGSPSSVVNTYGVTCHIEPALSRSAICLVRRSCKTFSAVGESGMTRRDFAVLVSVTTSSPSTRARVPRRKVRLEDRSTGEASGSTPPASPRLRRRPSPWPPGPRKQTQTGSSPPPAAAGLHREPANIHRVRAGVA